MNTFTNAEITQIIKSAQFDKNHIDYLKEKIDAGHKLTQYELEGYQRYLSLGGCTSAVERSTAMAQHKLWDIINPKIKSLLVKRAKIENYGDIYNQLYILFIHKLHTYDPAKGPFFSYFARHATIEILKINTATNIKIHHSIIFSVLKAKSGQKIENKAYEKDEKFAKSVDLYTTAEHLDFDEFSEKIHTEEENDLKKDLESVFARWIFMCRDDLKSVNFLQQFLDTGEYMASIKKSGISRQKAQQHIAIISALLKKDYSPTIKTKKIKIKDNNADEMSVYSKVIAEKLYTTTDPKTKIFLETLLKTTSYLEAKKLSGLSEKSASEIMKIISIKIKNYKKTAIPEITT